MEGELKRYRIPENFIDEGRIIKGMVRTRYFFEGCIMALIAAIPAFLIPVANRTQRISVVVVICGIPLLLGIVGINGDPISVVLRNLKNWRSSRGVMLYNTETVALKTAPLTASMNEKRASDTLIEMAENYRENKRRKMDAEVFVEGVTFQFAKDPELRKLQAKKLDLEDEYPVTQDPDEAEEILLELDIQEKEELFEISEDEGDWEEGPTLPVAEADEETDDFVFEFDEADDDDGGF